MRLMTPELSRSLPPMGSNQDRSFEKIEIHLCYRDRDSGISWYVMEFDGADRFFGIVAGLQAVLGEFTLGELEALACPESGKAAVEVDTGFETTTILSLAQREKAIAELLPQPPDLIPLE